MIKWSRESGLVIDAFGSIARLVLERKRWIFSCESALNEGVWESITVFQRSAIIGRHRTQRDSILQFELKSIPHRMLYLQSHFFHDFFSGLNSIFHSLQENFRRLDSIIMRPTHVFLSNSWRLHFSHFFERRETFKGLWFKLVLKVNAVLLD